MSWTATERFALQPAPGGVALVQELLNTRAIAPYGPDILAGAESGPAWVHAVVASWARQQGWEAPDAPLEPGDLQRLIALRARLTAMAAGEEPAEGAAAFSSDVLLTVRTDASGQVTLVPQGSAGEWLEGAVWSQVLLAQRDDTWRRLKLCREPRCRSAFYDRSRNNSGVWHDVRSCGNAANLRASRARAKRAAS